MTEGQIGRYGGKSIRELYDLLDEQAAQLVQVNAVHPHACKGAFERLKLYCQHLQDSRDSALNRETDLRQQLAQVTAERDDARRSTQEAINHHDRMTEKWVDEMRHWKQRAEAAEAQCAALVGELDSVVALLEAHRDTPPIQAMYHEKAAASRQLLANLPAAAEKLLAAQRACKAKLAFKQGVLAGTLTNTDANFAEVERLWDEWERAETGQ